MRTRFTGLLMVGVLALAAFATASMAADEKVDATGTWKWTFSRGDQKVEMSVKLKQDGEKLTGAFVGRDGKETEITDGKVAGDEVTFSVTREVNGEKRISKYTGKISGDTIKGKIASGTGDQARSRDWEATRAK